MSSHSGASAVGREAMPASEVAAWTPIVAATYAIVIAAVLLFLAAGFGSINGLLDAVGRIGPASDRIGRYVALAVIVCVATAALMPVARGRLAKISAAGDVARHLGSMLALALLLSFPPVQWLTFGRPEAVAAHDHHVTEPAAVNRRADSGGKVSSGHQDAQSAEPVTEEKTRSRRPGDRQTDPQRKDCAKPTPHAEANRPASASRCKKKRASEKSGNAQGHPDDGHSH